MENQPQYKSPTIQEFNEMNIAQKRVAIAQDVIQAVDTKKYIAQKNKFISVFVLNGKDRISRFSIEVEDDECVALDDDIQQILPQMTECHVCALGACILSITKFENKLKFRDIGRAGDEFTEKTDELIKNIFTPLQFTMIEVMFEGAYRSTLNNYGRDRLNATLLIDEANTCIRFSRNYKDNDTRMVAIMQHIIDNNGEIIIDKLISFYPATGDKISVSNDGSEWWTVYHVRYENNSDIPWGVVERFDQLANPECDLQYFKFAKKY